MAHGMAGREPQQRQLSSSCFSPFCQLGGAIYELSTSLVRWVCVVQILFGLPLNKTCVEKFLLMGYWVCELYTLDRNVPIIWLTWGHEECTLQTAHEWNIFHKVVKLICQNRSYSGKWQSPNFTIPQLSQCFGLYEWILSYAVFCARIRSKQGRQGCGPT